jgi:hypothetical protein
MRCATKDCAGCEVATSHALLRKFVASEMSEARTCDWRRWPWPLVVRDFKPEDLSAAVDELTSALGANDRRDTLAARFAHDLKAVLA